MPTPDKHGVAKCRRPKADNGIEKQKWKPWRQSSQTARDPHSKHGVAKCRRPKADKQTGVEKQNWKPWRQSSQTAGIRKANMGWLSANSEQDM